MPRPLLLIFICSMWGTWWQKMAGAMSVILAIGGLVSMLLGWAQWATLSLWAAAAVCIVTSSYHVWAREYKRRVILQERIKSFPRLQLVAKAVYTENITLFLTVETREAPPIRLTGPSVFVLKLRLRNNPIYPTSDSVAKGVCAHIVFRDPYSGAVMCDVDGRWADSTPPNRRAAGQDITEVLAVDFPVGQARSLDVVFKHPEDEQCYPFNNDSYGYPDFKNPAWKMPKGRIVAAVNIKAPYLDYTATIIFENPGKTRIYSPHKVGSP